MIKAIVYHNEEQIKTYEFEKSAVLIGRLSNNDIQLNSLAVSRLHLKIYYDKEKGKYVAFDADSQNGTYVDGMRIVESVIESGARLTLGEYVIVPEFVGAASSDENYDDAEKNSTRFSTNEKIPIKAFLIELNNKIIYKINRRVMSFGSAPDDDFFIESGVFASQNTATLTVNDEGYNVRSNTIMGKFKVNGIKKNDCLLQNKDSIEFGDNVFTFKIKSE